MDTQQRFGHVLLTSVFIGVAALMFLPSLIVGWQYRSIDVGDKVIVPQTSGMGGDYTVIKTDGLDVTIRDNNSGEIYKVDYRKLVEN